MATTITLEEQTAKALQTLREQAAARGLPLAQYLQALAANSDRVLGPVQGSPQDLSPEVFRRWLSDLSEGMPEIPPLPPDFSRADLYDDHD